MITLDLLSINAIFTFKKGKELCGNYPASRNLGACAGKLKMYTGDRPFSQICGYIRYSLSVALIVRGVHECLRGPRQRQGGLPTATMEDKIGLCV